MTIDEAGNYGDDKHGQKVQTCRKDKGKTRSGWKCTIRSSEYEMFCVLRNIVKYVRVNVKYARRYFTARVHGNTVLGSKL